MARSPRQYFLDTSALAKLYIKEPGSRRLAQWLGERTPGHSPAVRLFVSRMVLPETISAITRRRNTGTVHPGDALRLWNLVFADFARLTPRFEVIEATEAVVLRAALLVATHGLRAYDAVQLASALWLQMRLSDPQSLVFVSADQSLNAAAQAERLTTADPTL